MSVAFRYGIDLDDRCLTRVVSLPCMRNSSSLDTHGSSYVHARTRESVPVL